jgi:glycosyltransferase involved in cell wall biosynthesis
MRILLPINLDRARSPISCLLREVGLRCPHIEFYGGFSPVDEEDRQLGAMLRSLPNIQEFKPSHLLTRKFDLVHHASASVQNYSAARLSKFRSMGMARHLFTANCQPYPTHPRLSLLRKCVRNADHLVSVSQVVSDDFERELGRSAERVIPNGFNEDFYTLADRAQGESSKGFVLFASMIKDRKNPQFVLELANRLPEIRFVVVGSKVDDDGFSDRTIAQFKSISNINYLGVVPRWKLRDLMQEAHILIHPSDFEGLPLTVIEALGTGLPVLAQPKSSLPEIIRSENEGWLFPLSEVDDWTAKVREVFSWSPEERNEFAGRARKSVLDRFSWRKIAEQYASFYEEIVSKS